MGEPQAGAAYPPSELLAEELEARRMTAAILAGRMKWRVRDVEDLIAGRTAMTETAASALEAALGISAELWTRLEAAYRSDRARLGG